MLTISIKRGTASGNQNLRAVSASTILDMAFKNEKAQNFSTVSAQALHSGLSRYCVGYCRIVAAASVMLKQAKLVGKLCRLEPPPTVVATRLAFDESSQTCYADVDGGGSVKSSWAVLLTRCRLLCAWTGADGKPRSIEICLVVPPVLLLSTSAEQIDGALQRHPMFSTLNGLLDILRRKARFSFQLVEGDSAYGNLRWHHFKLWADRQAGAKHLREFLVCP